MGGGELPCSALPCLALHANPSRREAVVVVVVMRSKTEPNTKDGRGTDGRTDGRTDGIRASDDRGRQRDRNLNGRLPPRASPSPLLYMHVHTYSTLHDVHT